MAKKLLALLLAVALLMTFTVPVFAQSVDAAPTAADSGKTIYVGIITYLNLNKSNYQVHYWGGAASGDANLTALDTTAQQSVGNSYWSNGAQTFDMYKAVIPADATGYKVHNGDTWFGNDGNVSQNNAAYVFEYGGSYNAYYGTYTEPVTPTEAPTSAPETEAPTTAPATEAPATQTPVETITVYFTDALNWGEANVYYWQNGPEWPGTAMTKCMVNDYSQQV